MLITFRGIGAFLVGTCLTGSVAQAQFGLDFFDQPDCAVPAPSCAVGDVSCAPSCVPARPPARYEICPPVRPMPCAPVTYHVHGPTLAPSGCAEVPCAPPVHYEVRCAPARPAPCVRPISCVPPVSCAPVSCAPVGCTDTGCAPGGKRCLTDDGLFGWNVGGLLGEGDGSGISLVGGTLGEGSLEDKSRRFRRNWYYESFDHHRHLNYPIISPAGHPTDGYYRTCWELFPEGRQWCPPCYNQSSRRLSGYNSPSVYPPRATPTPPAPATAPAKTPAAIPQAPPANPAAAPQAGPVITPVLPTTSAAQLYSAPLH